MDEGRSPHSTNGLGGGAGSWRESVRWDSHRRGSVGHGGRKASERGRGIRWDSHHWGSIRWDSHRRGSGSLGGRKASESILGDRNPSEKHPGIRQDSHRRGLGALGGRKASESAGMRGPPSVQTRSGLYRVYDASHVSNIIAYGLNARLAKLANHPHDCRPHNRSVGDSCHTLGLLRCGDAKPYGTG